MSHSGLLWLCYYTNDENHDHFLLFSPSKCCCVMHLPALCRSCDAGWGGDQWKVRQFKSSRTICSSAHPTQQLSGVARSQLVLTGIKERPERDLRSTDVCATLPHLPAEGWSHGGRLSASSCATLWWFLGNWGNGARCQVLLPRSHPLAKILRQN